MPSKERVSFAQLKVGILGIVALGLRRAAGFPPHRQHDWFKKQDPAPRLHLGCCGAC